MRWPKYWSFSFSIIPFKEIPGLISFRMDWLDLLASPRDSQESSPTPQFTNSLTAGMWDLVPWSGMKPRPPALEARSLSHWKRLWCWEGLGAGGEGEDRGWDGWMASLTQWMWVWVNSGSWWWTGRPGVLRFMGLQRVRHDWATELNWIESWLMVHKTCNFTHICAAVCTSSTAPYLCPPNRGIDQFYFAWVLFFCKFKKEKKHVVCLTIYPALLTLFLMGRKFCFDPALMRLKSSAYLCRFYKIIWTTWINF